MKTNLAHIVISTLDSFIVFIILILISCTGGSNDSIPISNLGGKVNAAGYPDVTGNYSFNTGEISYTCSKGNSGTSPPVALNFTITQIDNQIYAYNYVTPPGFTFIDTGVMTGYIEKTSKFAMNQNVTATIDSILGSNVITYNISGSVNFSGWAGDYTYNVFNDYSNDTCTYRTTFTGDYISP
jgi:hypothetical protein